MGKVVITRKGEGKEDILGRVRLLQKIKTKSLKGLQVEMEPFEEIPRLYSHPGEEIRIVLRGEIEVMVGDEKHLLSEGDVMWFDAEIPHTVRNPGSEKAVFFVVGVPASLG